MLAMPLLLPQREFAVRELGVNHQKQQLQLAPSPKYSALHLSVPAESSRELPALVAVIKEFPATELLDREKPLLPDAPATENDVAVNDVAAMVCVLFARVSAR